MSDNVVNFKQDGTRQLLEKVLQAYDDGIIASVALVAQGVTQNDEGKDVKVLMPLVSEETTIEQAAVAAKVLNIYAEGAISGVLTYGERRDI